MQADVRRPSETGTAYWGNNSGPSRSQRSHRDVDRVATRPYTVPAPRDRSTEAAQRSVVPVVRNIINDQNGGLGSQRGTT